MNDETTAMSGPELVNKYNALITSDAAQGLKDFGKTIQKFSSIAVGVKRLEQLESSIRARSNGEQEENSRDEKPKPKDDADDLLATFQARNGSILEKTIKVLIKNLGEPIAKTALSKTIYGKTDGPIDRVLAGVESKIKKYKLKMVLVTSDEKPKTITLKSK